MLLGAVEVAVLIFTTGNALTAFRRVYGERWPSILAKSAGIALLYGMVGFAGLIGVVAWTTIR